MGGGDLNLKKSWHPSTMRNMEKVWKAEQKHDQEKKRIAELQREIREERAREDIKKYAEDTGVVEKKDGMKLDWMYKGPSGVVDREEYLLGRRIDKTFEQLEQAEKPSTSSTTSKNSVEHDCVPPSIFSGGDEQVDMARKLQEDPLLLIKKKEMETRAQILNNPVKLRQLRDILKQSTPKKNKKHKKGKRKEGKKKYKSGSDSSDDSDCGEDLDALLVKKYRKLKMKLHKTDIANLGASDSSSNSEPDNRHGKESASCAAHKRRKREHSRNSSEDESRTSDLSRGYGLVVPDSKRRVQRKASRPDERHAAEAPTRHRVAEAARPVARPERKKLSEEEMERRRQEMMDNAKWREAIREKNVAKYKAEDRREKLQQSKNYDADFTRKQLSYAASKSSVESRIKSKANNIQRSERSMHENFARR